MATSAWNVEILSTAERELDELPQGVRAEALQSIDDLREDPFPSDAEPIRGVRNRYRIRFYRNRYRIIYDVSERQKKIVVDRIRRRDPHTYSGMVRW